MAQFRITKIAAISGLCILALAAMPGLATVAGAHESTQAPAKRAPMDNGPSSGGRGGQAGPGFGMGSGRMGSGMMGSGMMGSGTGMVPGYEMRPGAGPGQGHGARVVPKMGLTTKDVRRSLEQDLARQGNKRLNVGEVKQADDDTITADIVTKDNSLVQRLKVDRHTGRMQQVN